MKKMIIIAVCITAMTICSISGAKDIQLARPSQKQVDFADWEVGAFFHYTLNPFTDQEHGDGQEPPSKFNPTTLDVEQWIITAKSMGAKYAVLTARHEGGFCLWPSKTTDYTVASSPYKNGKGDIVREYVDACRKYGIKVGLYHTASHDAHATLGSDYKSWGKYKLPLDWMTTWGKAMAEAHRKDPSLKERFKKIQVEQMRELLTWYGPIDFMWSDHWNAIEPDGVWRAVTDLAAELQPEMVFMGPETTTPGNESGHVVYPMWNAVYTIDGTNYSRARAEKGDKSVPNTYGLLETDVRAGHPLGKFWRVRECTTHRAFHYGGWFWHPDSFKKTYPRQHWEHIDLYYRTVGLGANTIINLPIDTRGLIPDDIVAAAKAMGDEIRRRFANPIAETNSVTQGDIVELAWEKPQEINTIVTMENIANGQKIAKYTLEAFVDEKWQELTPNNGVTTMQVYNPFPLFETIGHKKIDRVYPVVTDRIRFRCLESVVKPVELRKLQVFKCDPVPKGIKTSFPYLSGVRESWAHGYDGLKRDRNFDGDPITFNGKIFDNGVFLLVDFVTRLGVIEYDLSRLPEKVKGFTATIGIDDRENNRGSSVFKVECSTDREKWTEIFRSKRLTGSNPGMPIDVKFPAEARYIRLIATDGGDGAQSDHHAWADAKFYW